MKPVSMMQPTVNEVATVIKRQLYSLYNEYNCMNIKVFYTWNYL